MWLHCNDLCEKFAGDSLDYQLQRMNIATTKSIVTFSKLPVCQKPFSTDINLSPKHPNMIHESYDSLPFLDDESEMQVLTLFQKQTGQTC